MKTIPLWRSIQRQSITCLDRLTTFLELSDAQRSELIADSHFPLQVPLRLASKIQKRTLNDPILRQFIPHTDEMHSPDHFSLDPVGDLAARKSPRLLHKYEGRVLILTTSSCAMHCRFCFRKNFPYESAPSDFQEELQIIQSDPSMQEVILSGGDPLALSNESLQQLFSSLAAIPHLRRVRIHTRFPIGIPERIDEALLQLFAYHPQQLIFVVHCNHPSELDADIFQALGHVKQLDIPVLVQTVLLKGVNDQEKTLLLLYETLINRGILPYYLYLLDRVIGSAHFEVPLERGKELIAYLKEQLPGYGVPKLAYEEAGKKSKTTCD